MFREQSTMIMDSADRIFFYEYCGNLICNKPLLYKLKIGMRNRQKDEIMRDVLYSAQGGATITKIMFHAYLTHSQAKEYTLVLMKNGLLEEDFEAASLRQFRTTPKGVEYLAAAERMSNLLAIETRRAAKPGVFLL